MKVRIIKIGKDYYPMKEESGMLWFTRWELIYPADFLLPAGLKLLNESLDRGSLEYAEEVIKLFEVYRNPEIFLEKEIK